MQKGAQSSWYKKRGKGHRGKYLGQKPRKVDHYEEIKRVGASPFVRISRSVIVNIWHIVKMEECENKTGIIWVTGNTSEALRPLHLSRRMGERLYEMIGKQKGSLPDKLHV